VSIALAGNPNSGKTTLFNALTGLRYKVANYPGVTVERKRGSIQLGNEQQATVFDLPGIYSLIGTSIDEKIATAVLLGQLPPEPVPDCVIVVVDASNLERNLYLTTQLIDCGLPVVVALNMIDLAERRGLVVHNQLLSKQLDVPVVSIVANKKIGLDSLREEVERALHSRTISGNRFSWSSGPNGATNGSAAGAKFHSYAEKLGNLYLRSQSQQVDSRIPVVMGCGLLSDALHSNDREVLQELTTLRADLVADGIDPSSFEATSRYQWINQVVKKCTSQKPAGGNPLADRMDALLTHRIWGTVIFVLIMSFIFQSIFLWAQAPMDLIDGAFSALGGWVRTKLPDGQFQSLIVDGVISGVGNVVIFVPQIAILFFFLGLLEDSGYLARAAFLMDKFMRPFGLQGRSFIPLLSSFACAIPGILASRTIPSWADRMATIMIAPLMSCSARLPVYTLLISAFIPQQYVFGFLSLQGLVLFGMYLLGIIGAAVVAWLLKLSILRGKPALFVMEMPPVRRPQLKTVLRSVWDRVMTFLQSAGTVILACAIVLWFLASYPKPPPEYSGSKVQYSFAGRVGTAMEPLIRPLGYNWQIGVGILASFAAREVFISAMATVYNLDSPDGDNSSVVQLLKEKNKDGSFQFPVAISLMVFFVFACQCMSTLAVCRRETGSLAWTAFMFCYMTALAYVSAFAAYHIALAMAA
jgi:ferrous iron transport protein B